MPFPLRESISLDGEDLTLFGFSAAGRGNGQQQGNDQETNVPQISGEPVDISEEPLVMDTFHLGAFYSWRLLGGTYAYAINADARFPRLLLPGPYQNIVTLPGATDDARCGMDYAGDFLIGAGRTVYRIPGGTGAPVADHDLGAGIVAWQMDTFNGGLYVGTSTGPSSSAGPDMLHEKIGGTWSTPNGAVRRKALAHAWYQAQATGATGATQLIASDSPSSVTNVATAPLTAANWGASIPVGDTTYGINSLVSDQAHVYVAKTNGLHDVDGTTGYTPNLMPFFADGIDDLNGVATGTIDGQVYANHLSGLYRLDVSGGSTAGRIVSVTPGHGLPNETPVRGRITAICGWGPWTIAAVYNGVDTYICWGRDIMQGDAGVSPFGYGYGYGPSPSALSPSPMLWHGGLTVLPGQRCFLLAISGLTQPPRLWIGAAAPGGPYTVQWCVIPRTENPLQDAEYQFAQSWQFYVPGQDWGHVATPKDLLEVDVEGDGLGIGAYVNINVNADGGNYSLFGMANTSPQSILIGSQDFIGRRLGFRLDGFNSNEAPAIVRALMPRGQVRVAVRQVRQYEVLLGEGNVDRFGGRDIGRAIVQYRRLQLLQNSGRVSLRDEWGDTYQVLIQPPITRRMVNLRGESGKGTAEPVLVAQITMKILGPPNASPVVNYFWDDGTRWDAGTVWWR